jgi:hypothetical protein
MAVNTDEEHLEHSGPIQSENPPEAIIPNNTIEPINPNQESKNMEVHHHAHHGHEKKTWKNYFWEFFMLFLAVFCGFLAEYQLEHVIEHQREKQYITSLINDLKADTLKLSEVIDGFEKVSLMQDTLLKTFYTINDLDNELFLRNFNGIMGYPDFIYSDATINQLKNAGGFRIFRNRNDIDSIMAYDAIVKKALLNEGIHGRYYEQLQNLTKETFNIANLFNKQSGGLINVDVGFKSAGLLIEKDQNTLIKYFNHLVYYLLSTKSRILETKDVKVAAIKLIKYLEKEYHLE